MSPSSEVMANAITDRPGWHRARASVIGASDMPKILGLAHPSHGGGYSVYADKIAPVPEPEPVDGPLARGLALEPIIGRMAAEKLGVSELPPDQHLRRSLRWRWMGATIDARHPAEGAPIEFKSTAAGSATDAPSGGHQAQVQQQIAVEGATHGYLAVLYILPWIVEVWRLERDSEFIETAIVPAGDRFWEAVETRSGWPVDAHSMDAWRRVHLLGTGATVRLDPGCAELVDRWDTARKAASAWDAERKRLRDQIEIRIGDASAGTLPDGRILTYTATPGAARVLRLKGER